MRRKNTDSELSKSEKKEEGYILNPELEGGSFFWKGGETGVLLLHGLTATTAEAVSYTHLTLPTILLV